MNTRISEPTKGIISFTLSSFVVFSSFLFFLFMSLPSTVVYGQDFGLRKNINSISTQAFGFFTKDPKSQDFLPVSNEEGSEGQSLLVTPQTKPANWFGIKRDQRAQGPEMAFLGKSGIHRKIDCGGDPGECFARAIKFDPLAVNNYAPNPTLCGRVVMLIVEPTPFHYREMVKTTSQATGAIYLDVSCV